MPAQDGDRHRVVVAGPHQRVRLDRVVWSRTLCFEVLGAGRHQWAFLIA
jgi:hypothetical protein